MVLNDMLEAWVNMFGAIDSFIAKTVHKYPDIADMLDRDSIEKAVRKTEQFSQLIDDAKDNSTKKNQEMLPF